jgi:hypothetical protein
MGLLLLIRERRGGTKPLILPRPWQLLCYIFLCCISEPCRLVESLQGLIAASARQSSPASTASSPVCPSTSPRGNHTLSINGDTRLDRGQSFAKSRTRYQSSSVSPGSAAGVCNGPASTGIKATGDPILHAVQAAASRTRNWNERGARKNVKVG